MRRVTVAVTILALAASSLPAQRTQNPRRGQGQGTIWEFLQSKYDKNGDAKITKAEYDRGAEKFAVYDRNKDGVVTKEDFATRGRRSRRAETPEQIGRMIVQCADGDQDREVTGDEWQDFVRTLCGDSKVVAVTKLAALTRRMGGRARVLGDRSAQRVVTVLDADKSGALEVGELNAVFKALDKDANKALAWDEMGLRRVLPVAGEVAPDFELPTLGAAEKLVKLSSLAGKKPVALIFGSYT